jgi:hypothetical protein
VKIKILLALYLAFVFSLVLSQNIFAATDNKAFYSNYVYPKAAYKSGINSPFNSKDSGKEDISAATGDLTISTTDLYLKGINGLDLNLTRYYSSTQANMYEPYANSVLKTRPAYCTITVYYAVMTVWEYNMLDPDGSQYSVVYGPYSTSDVASAVVSANSGLYEIPNSSPITYLSVSGTVESDPSTEYYTEEYYEYTENVKPATSIDNYSNLGTGWSFDLPYLEPRDSFYYLHMGKSGTWQYDTSNTLSHLKDYNLSDMILNTDSGTYTNGQMTSSYVLQNKDGQKTYFGSDGRLLGVRDRFGNEIKFQHETASTGKPLINKIIDTVGREVGINYSATQVTISVNDTTDSSKNRQIIYYKTQIPGYSGEYVLSSVKDAENRVTNYTYEYNPALFTYLNKSLASSVTNYYACLTKITYPTNGETRYSYEKKIRNCGNEGAMEFYKINTRYDWKNDGINYNFRDYNYGAEYDGYPNYYSDSSIPDTFTFQNTVVLTAQNSGNTAKYTFNKKLLCTNQLNEGSDYKNETINEYDATKRLITKTTKKTYSKATVSFISQILNYTYDAFGDVLGFWDAQAARDTNGNPINDEHKTTYAYNSTYHYLTSKTYRKDAATIITEENIPNSGDNRLIQFNRVKENDVLKKQTEFVYDSLGNVTEERRYFDDWASAM